jgi:hypothetical protein
MNLHLHAHGVTKGYQFLFHRIPGEAVTDAKDSDE